MKVISQILFGAAWWFVALSLISCEPKKPKVEQAPDTSTHIDSEILADSVGSIAKKTTVREFLLALNLYENTDLSEDVLDDELLILVAFEGRENIVNEWSLAGGGGIRFTTRYNAEGEEQGGGPYSVHIMDEVVTSFDYAINGVPFSARLIDDQYVLNEP